MTEKTKLIAETAWHHEGDFEFMINLVNNIIKSKTDIIKLHLTLDLEEYMDKKHPAYDTLKGWMFNEDQWTKIIRLIKDSKKELMLLFNDIKSIKFGMKFDPQIVEIHSVCLNDIHLLGALKEEINQDTSIVLGVGGSTLQEINNVIQLLDHPNIVPMFGFQNYPTKYEDINFKKIKKIMNLYPMYSFGYADHTAWDEPNNELITLFGASIGMRYIEKHVTTKHGLKRCDWNSAISIKMFNNIAEGLELLSDCQGNGLLDLNKGELDYTVVGPMKKAAHLKADVNVGDILSKDNIYFKRTSEISDLSQVKVLEMCGHKFTTNLKKDYCIMLSDLI